MVCRYQAVAQRGRPSREKELLRRRHFMQPYRVIKMAAAARLEIPWLGDFPQMNLVLWRWIFTRSRNDGWVNSAEGGNHMRSPTTRYIKCAVERIHGVAPRLAALAGCCCELSIECELSHRRLPSGGLWYATFYSVDRRMERCSRCDFNSGHWLEIATDEGTAWHGQGSVGEICKEIWIWSVR